MLLINVAIKFNEVALSKLHSDDHALLTFIKVCLRTISVPFASLNQQKF